MKEVLDFNFDDVCRDAQEFIAQGCAVYQKFTCRNCGSRQTIDVPNTFYTHGSCEECHYITNLKKAGCNFMLITGLQFSKDEIQDEQTRSAHEVSERGNKS